MIKKSFLDKAVEEYNKYHGAEAHVKVLKQHPKGKSHLLVRFKGPFCMSCAPEEYYTDFQLLLEETTGQKFKISSVQQETNGAVVDFEHVEDDTSVVYVSHY